MRGGNVAGGVASPRKAQKRKGDVTIKLTKKQMNAIVARTPAELVDTCPYIAETLGYYSRPEWNWGYKAGWTSDGVLCVTQFGHVVGHRI